MTESKPARKLVLLGKTGAGSSSSGNKIFGKDLFKTESSPLSITAKCTTKSEKVGGREVTIVDTPGIFDTCRKEEDIRSGIVSSIIECAPAVDAFVIVLKVERYTRQEKEILDKMVEYCGEDIFKHAVILFTHGDQLEGQTIEQFVQKSTTLQELVNKCGGRCHVIDNRYWNDCNLGYRSNKFHVKNLLNTIDKMVKENGQYTNELMLKAEEDIQEEMNMLKDNLSTEEKREVAKKIVHNKFLIRFAGVATGTLIGAFLGITVAVASVVVFLKAASLKVVAKTIGTALTAGGVLDKVAVAAAAGGAVGAGAGTAAAGAAAVEAGLAAGAAAAAGTAAVETGVAAGAAAAAGTAAVETGVAAGAGIGAAAGSGIAAGVVFGVAALAGAIGGGITGYKATEEADSVLDAIKTAAKVNFENAKEVVKKAEELPSNLYKKLQ